MRFTTLSRSEDAVPILASSTQRGRARRRTQRRGSAIREGGPRVARGLSRALLIVGVLSSSAFVASTGGSAGAAVTKSQVSFNITLGVPNYIFPFDSAGFLSAPNILDFQYYMYRPLYWFGSHRSAAVNQRLSLAELPVFSDHDTKVEIKLKPYSWSDGETVTTKDVLFWMNIWKQKPTAYGGWFPGGQSIPTNVTSIDLTSPTTLTLALKSPVNPHWFLYDQLSEITPLPLAWTRSSTTGSAGAAGCAEAPYGADASGCAAVYRYLSEQSGYDPTNPKVTPNALPTYASNPLWQIVDGPWRLKTFQPTSTFTMVPNPKYSGPNKPHVQEVVFKAYTSYGAEYSALAAGTLDIGELPPDEVSTPAKRAGRPGHPPKLGQNNARLDKTYNMSAGHPWEIGYFLYNFRSTGDAGEAGPIFRQLYFRQAVQRLVNQTLYVSRITKGYGMATYGPVPVSSKNQFVSPTELKNPYPYDPQAAKRLLASHGWKVVPGGVSVCERPGTGHGHCGKGIRKGAKLTFNLQYGAGTKSVEFTMEAEKASWAQVGIRANLSAASINEIYGVAEPCPKGCKWELENWIGGWIFFPDIYPSGTEILAKGAESNEGMWQTDVSTRLIRATVSGSSDLTKYENWEERQLPVVWQPLRIPLWEVHKGLEGVAPMGPLGTMTPATFRWS